MISIDLKSTMSIIIFIAYLIEVQYYNPINFYQAFLFQPFTVGMPAQRTKKNNQKSAPKNVQTNLPKPLHKIKFNISMDNLRPFLDGKESTQSLRKRPLFKQIDRCRDKKSIKTEQDRRFSFSYTEILRREGKSPDISREVSNQILQKIQANGIRFNWKQLQQVKSEFAQDQEQTDRQAQVWRSTYPATSYDKNYSIASTNDHYSSYIASMYQYQFTDYNYIQKRNQDPNYFLIDPCNINNDQRTTLMIKNIPNKYTIQFLAEEIDREYVNSYDFLYLPCDIKNNCNVGYGFINFLNTELLQSFYDSFHNKRWGKFKSQKICNLTYARLQGLNSLIEHFQNSKVLNNKDKKYQPIIRDRINQIIKQQKFKSNNQA